MDTLYGDVTVSGRIKVLMFACGSEGAIKESVMTDRGPAPSCGDGPYFVARKKPDSIYVDGVKIDLSMQCYHDGRYCNVGCSGEKKDYYLQLWPDGQAAYHTYIFKRFEGNNLVYDWWYLYAPAGSVPFPTSTAQAISECLSICAWMEEHGQTMLRMEMWQPARSANVISGGATFNFKNGEYDAFCCITNLGIFPKGFAGKFSAAYKDAIDSLDLTDVNTIANIGQAIDFCHVAFDALKSPLKALKKLAKSITRAGSSIHRTAGSAWLKYRYEYMTTKSDVKEYKALVQRLKSLSDLAGRRIRSSGHFGDETGSYRCQFRLYADQLLPDDVDSWLETIGVDPTPVNLWDLVPYSFIVDWVIPVSKVLDYFDSIGNEFRYDVEDCWFTYMSEYDGQHVFFRVPGRRLDVLPQYVEKQASTKTIKMRVADTVALLWR